MVCRDAYYAYRMLIGAHATRCYPMLCADVPPIHVSRMPTVLDQVKLLPMLNSSDFVVVLNSPPFTLEFTGNQLRGCRLAANFNHGYVVCDTDCATGAGHAALPAFNPNASFLDASWACRRLGVVACGNFDIILDHLSGMSGLFTTPHTPCTVLYLVAMLIGC